MITDDTSYFIPPSSIDALSEAVWVPTVYGNLQASNQFDFIFQPCKDPATSSSSMICFGNRRGSVLGKRNSDLFEKKSSNQNEKKHDITNNNSSNNSNSNNEMKHVNTKKMKPTNANEWMMDGNVYQIQCENNEIEMKGTTN